MTDNNLDAAGLVGSVIRERDDARAERDRLDRERSDWKRWCHLAEKRNEVLLVMLGRVMHGDEIEWDELDPELLTKISEAWADNRDV